MPAEGLSGVPRKYAYATFSGARAAHWLILLAAFGVLVPNVVRTRMTRGRAMKRDGV